MVRETKNKKTHTHKPKQKPKQKRTHKPKPKEKKINVEGKYIIGTQIWYDLREETSKGASHASKKFDHS